MPDSHDMWHLSGLYMARHEAGSHEARHTSCAPCGPRAFTWQVCQPASQTSCWPEIRMYWQQRPFLCINIYIYIYIYYVDIILLILNKREKSEAKWEKTCPCLQILSLHFEIIFTALTWNNFLYIVQWDFAYIYVQCRKCQANVLSTSK